MSDHTDEFDFTEFTEDELRAIDSAADVAFATQTVPTVWPSSPSDPQIATSLGIEVEQPSPRSRKSSGFSTLELTEEELRLIDESVARLGATNDPPSPSAVNSENTQLAPIQSQPSFIEIAIESPIPSTLAPSPAPTLGRSPSSSPATMNSLYSQFRASRNSLSVSDLVGPIWCEVQFDYGLRGKRNLPPSQRPAVVQTRSGREIKVQRDVAVKNDRVLKKGTAVHKKLEQEIRPIEVEITPKTREDIWGLKMFNMLSNIRILLDEGRCREMPVMGFLHGHFVTGIIDEIIYTPCSPTSPTIPGAFPGQRLASISGMGPTHVINILDNKTRAVNSKPRERDTLQSRIQLMLYKRLLDGLLMPAPNQSPKASSETLARLSLPDVWAHHSLDPSARFSPSFLDESAILVASNGLGPEAERATCLKELEDIWNALVDELAVTTGFGDHEPGVVSKTLKLVYRLRGGALGAQKRSARGDSSSASGSWSQSGSSRGESRESSPKGKAKAPKRNKKIRAESEDLDLQRAIHASLANTGSQTQNIELQAETGELVREQRKDESEGSTQEIDGAVHAPGGWISHDNDLRRAIEESKKSYMAETGRDVSSSPPPSPLRDLNRKREPDEGIIGTIEFEYDNTVLGNHLQDVFDFWHDRRPPRGVAIEDTGRCRYCEFSDGCEWLEAKAKSIMEGTHS